MTGPYREPPPAPKLPPRTPWYRLAWALARGVIRRNRTRRSRQAAIAGISSTWSAGGRYLVRKWFDVVPHTPAGARAVAVFAEAKR